MAEKRLHTGNLVTVISVMILVGTEVFGFAIAFGWALAGIFELGDVVMYAMMAAFSAFGAYLLWMLLQSVLENEPIRQ